MTSAYEADPIFDPVPRQISNIVTRIHGGEVALPDFQRNFVWDAGKTEELIQSVISKFPVGTLLLWKQGGKELFASRNFEGSPGLGAKKPDELVLDGQQRLTSLYQALTGTGDELYYLKVDEFVRGDMSVKEFHEVDFEVAIISLPNAKPGTQQAKKNADILTGSHFPIAQVNNFDDWLDDYADSLKAADAAIDTRAVKSLYRKMRDKYVIPLRSYGLPALTLPESTPIEAVCTIFETLNRTGKPLGAFELLTARYYPQGVNLREYWDQARADYQSLIDFKIEPYSVLQAVSLRTMGSAQRSDILNKLTAKNIRENWSPVIKGIAGVIDMLQADCGVVAAKWLPYSMVIFPMAAVWQEVADLAPLERAVAFERLQKFFWNTVFTTNYDQGANSQAGADYGRLKTWAISGAGPMPEAIEDVPLDTSAFRTATVRRKALYAGLMCLLVKSRAEDFHTGQAMTPYRVSEKAIDSHHIFPKAFLARSGEKESSELLLNRSLIDAETNRIIKDREPSVYIKNMADTYGDDKLRSVLSSHAIKLGPDSGLETDAYSQFIDERLATIVQLIERATGRILSATDTSE